MSLKIRFRQGDIPECFELFESQNRAENEIDEAFSDTVYGSEYFIYTKYEYMREDFDQEVRSQIERLRSL